MIYEYKCKECGYKFQERQSVKDELIKKCPKCNGSVKKLISSDVQFIFKGPGFYRNDYKNREKQEDNNV